MAFLLPENIPSRSGVPDRLRQVARALRDFAPEQVTVWLRETENGLPYLVALDPASGIVVIDAPSLSVRGQSQRRRGRVFDSFDMIRIPQEVAQQASELRTPHRRGPHLRACQWSVCWPYLTTTRFLWSSSARRTGQCRSLPGPT